MQVVEEKILDPLGDGISQIQLIDYMGGDLAVVNDAKASFERVAIEMDDRQIGLLNYLAGEKHTSPFRGTVFKFKVKAPLYVCRQWWKHVLASNHNDEQLGWNERSFRYTETDDDADFYTPDLFKVQSKNNKQGSAEPLDEENQRLATCLWDSQCQCAYETYRDLLEMGVSREDARGVLPPAFYTSWVWTTSLQATLHFIDLRQGKGAQSAIQKYATTIEQLIAPIVPEAMKAWSAAKQLSVNKSALIEVLLRHGINPQILEEID